ncbi:MAG: hypothetical protein WBQ34_09955 [Candidatus Acidiferrales bacterium]
MKIAVESNVAKVADFMLNNLRAHELYDVAQAIAKLADFLWKLEYIDDANKPFRLVWAEDINAAEKSRASPVRSGRKY